MTSASTAGGEHGASSDLASAVGALGWYHTINLPGGIRTPGVFDTVGAAPRALLPPRLDGMRCLDVGTSNGFWAFEMERRGAREVLTIDISGPEGADWPAFDPMARRRLGSSRDAFELARKALASQVESRILSVYDVSRAELGGFDLIFAGTILLHLRDPVRALTALRDGADGELVLNESVSLPLTALQPTTPAARLIGTGGANWWVPNVAGLRRMVEAAGFEVVDTTRPYILRWGTAPRPRWGRSPTGAPIRGTMRNLGRALAGIPHAGLRATPRSD